MIPTLLKKLFPYQERIDRDKTNSLNPFSPKWWKGDHKRRSLIITALKYRKKQKLLLIILSGTATVVSMGVVYFQRKYVNLLTEKAPITSLWYIILVFFLTIFSQLFNWLARINAAREAMFFHRFLSMALYQKKMRLTTTAPLYRTVGETVSLYTQDIPSTTSILEDVFRALVEALFPLFLIPFMLGYFLNLPLWEVLLTLAASTSITLTLGVRQSKFFRKNKVNSQKRLGVVNEWLQNMRIIRILGLREKFEKEIIRKRILESKDRLTMVTNGSVLNSIAQFTPAFLNVVAVYSLLKIHDKIITPGDIFGILLLFSAFFVKPIRTLPFILVNLIDAVTSARRLESFFALPEEECLPEKPPLSASSRDFALSVKNLNLNLEGKPLINSLSFEIKHGEFIAIIGEVGAGKSVIFDSLFRILPATFSEYSVLGKNALSLPLSELRMHFSFVSQESFAMSATIKDNVTLCYNTSSELDTAAKTMLHLSQFYYDMTSEQISLTTEIGERGINISGGQKQRLNIARAAYFDRDIILLDDCLSAVDVNTEEKICATLLKGYWAKKTRILVTHRLSILEHVDRVFIIEDGKLVEEGSFPELTKTSARLQKFIRAGGEK